MSEDDRARPRRARHVRRHRPTGQRPPERPRPPHPDGSGQLVSRPYRFGSDDIDLDRTLEALTEHPVPRRHRHRRARTDAQPASGRPHRRRVGSMRGEKVRIAAATVGALAGALIDDELAVVAFWKDAVLVSPLDRREAGVGDPRSAAAHPGQGADQRPLRARRRASRARAAPAPDDAAPSCCRTPCTTPGRTRD